MPLAKRQYGYFSLPLLWGTEFVGRMDAKIDRKTHILHIQNLHLETTKVDVFIDVLKPALKAFKQFNDGKDMQVHKVTCNQPLGLNKEADTNGSAKMLIVQLYDTGTLKAGSRQQLKDSVQQIEHTILVLLALSREESFDKQPIGLLEEIEDCVINHFSLSNRANFELNVAVSADYKLQANKNLLHSLVNNLLDHVLNHGNAKCLSISLMWNSLVFQYPVEYQPVGNLLEPSVKSPNSKGLGIGLNLVKRICDCFDWHVSTSIANHLFPLTIRLADLSSVACSGLDKPLFKISNDFRRFIQPLNCTVLFDS